ncbi:MAG: hypothetical protein V4691_10295, partial [Pseudomonadota bacterium]
LLLSHPISHVPVATCQSVGMRARDRTAARSKEEDVGRLLPVRTAPRTYDWQPEKTGETRSPRVTWLEATT